MSELTRRQFFHDSLIAAAAAGAAGPIGKLLAAENTSTSITEKGPNEKLRFVICGVNGQGDSHIKNLLDEANKGQADIVAICDVDESVGNKRCDEIAKKTGGTRPKYYKDCREAFDNKDIDCVSAAVPNHWHALLAIWAMQAGKDVYTEKPAAYNISEGQRMIETARKHNRICQIGTQSRSMTGTIDAINFIKAGKIGDVNLARGICYKSRMSIGPAGEHDVPKNIDYNLWTGPAPYREKSRYYTAEKGPVHYNWHWFWDYGNGDMGNQGIHEMDVARWGLGVNQIANGVIAYGGRFGYIDAGETPNTINVLLDFGPKTLEFETRGLTNVKFKPLKGVDIGIIFEGTDGYVAMTSYTNGKAFDKDGKEIKAFSGGSYPQHHVNFIKAVHSRNKDDLHCDVEEGVLSACLVHMGNTSYRLGEKVAKDEVINRLKAVKSNDNVQDTLDRVVEHLKENGVTIDDKTMFQCGNFLKMNPQTMEFVGNDKANQMRTRDYRAPFVVPAAGQV
ncbi:MAG TPA: Gfo/Idh/MocA family oxidoreductase [Pirellulales bacterium]|jgi:predicted dehydrogenase|nr:Gfo/Idh/MocA family oxidoreductase [Pirellulales bacterium]